MSLHLTFIYYLGQLKIEIESKINISLHFQLLSDKIIHVFHAHCSQTLIYDLQFLYFEGLIFHRELLTLLSRGLC